MTMIRIKEALGAYNKGDLVNWAASEAQTLIDNGVAEYAFDEYADARMAYALRRIEADYGHRVSVAEKAKQLFKFGRNPDLGTSYETVWEYGGDETLPTTNAIDSVSSSNNDDTESLVVEGHTVSGTGASAQYTFVVQTVTLTGQTRAALSTPLARCSRVYVNSANAVAGDVYVFENDTLTSGVPQTASKVHNLIKGTDGHTQSYKAATTFSNTDYFICTGGRCSVLKKTAGSVDVVLEVRTPGSVFRPVAGRIALSTTGTTAMQIDFNPYVIVPRNADVRVRAIGSTTGLEVDAAFDGYLAIVT